MFYRNPNADMLLQEVAELDFDFIRKLKRKLQWMIFFIWQMLIVNDY